MAKAAAKSKVKAEAREVFEIPVTEVKEHPGHERVPDMQPDDYLALLQSVKLNGVQVPVEILSEKDAEKRGEKENAGTLVDGRQRVRAARECGLETVPAVYADLPENMDTTEYIFRKAIERRHLNKSQRAIMAVDLKRHFERGQGFRSDLLQEKFPEVGEGQARDRAGAILGVSGRYITTAEKLLEEAPDLAEQVRNGEKTLTQAVRELNRREGRTQAPNPVQKTRTMFRRLWTAFDKVKPSRELPKEQYEEVKKLLERLREILGTVEGGSVVEGQ